MNGDAIKAALNRIGQGLSAGDPVIMSEAWSIPATLFLDAGPVVAATAGQLGDLMKRTIQAQRKRELASTRPEIEHIEELTPKLAAVRVRWLGFDKSGVERSTERSYYLVEEVDAGVCRVRVSANVGN